MGLNFKSPKLPGTKGLMPKKLGNLFSAKPIMKSAQGAIDYLKKPTVPKLPGLGGITGGSSGTSAASAPAATNAPAESAAPAQTGPVSGNASPQVVQIQQDPNGQRRQGPRTGGRPGGSASGSVT